MCLSLKSGIDAYPCKQFVLENAHQGILIAYPCPLRPPAAY